MALFETPKELMVSVSGVRGRVAGALTPEIVARFTAAYGSYLHAERGGRPLVIVGRDSRTSGPMFVRAVVSALQSVGCDVREGYGLSETAPTATGYREGEAYLPGSVGRARSRCRACRRDATRSAAWRARYPT